MFLGESSYFSYKLIENISKINSVSFKFCTPKKFPKNNPLINYPVKNTSRICIRTDLQKLGITNRK